MKFLMTFADIINQNSTDLDAKYCVSTSKIQIEVLSTCH